MGPRGAQLGMGPLGELLEPVPGAGTRPGGRRASRRALATSASQSTLEAEAVLGEQRARRSRPGGCPPRTRSTRRSGASARLRRLRTAGDDGRHPGRTEEVDLDGVVEGGVEADGGGRVHDDVARGERRPARPSSSPSPSVDTSPATACRRPADRVVEAVAQLGAQSVEAVVAQDLARHPARRRRCGGPAGPGRTPRRRGWSAGCVR